MAARDEKNQRRALVIAADTNADTTGVGRNFRYISLTFPASRDRIKVQLRFR